MYTNQKNNNKTSLFVCNDDLEDYLKYQGDSINSFWDICSFMYDWVLLETPYCEG